ncbi:ATP-dependent nuclease [Flavobacterium ginsenosidimutans]|uniref:ATP-dependent nuclease n=1 Tax=Flavobacterium ginsenosidimutans TaxID=687844 RepID=UPI000DAC9EFE|nr:AAA family ATPase [Flavobacterium ginsenosidimutans]KAF2328098.1 AAA family ATPase [Flavobacterium ginsenosidimutans]
MYISQIEIKNFRNFKECEIQFNVGVNVIIGHNNAGKTNLLKALSLVIDHKGSKRLETDDFNKSLSIDDLQKSPPKISIALKIVKGTHSEPDDLVTIAGWLTKLDSTYEALLTYEFFLPEKELPHYLEAMKSITETDKIKAAAKAWKIIKHDFIRLYIHKIWGGDIVNQATAESESLQKFDFQFLDAIRDVERDMLTGRNTLLRDVFDFFMDYEIKKEPESVKPKKTKIAEIKKRKIEFSDKADDLIDMLQKRMVEGKEQILSYAKETGASSFNDAKPDFEGSMSDVEMFSVLKLIVEHKSGIKIPATHNGLGYNNLIYMSLLLAKMQVNSDGDYMGSNAKVYATLAIEEPEAHLHPAMQYKFLKFLKQNRKERKVRQIFVTSHSTNITSAVSLDEIICLNTEDETTTAAYPGRVFPDEHSKKYVQRFLDATKSDMLFAKNVILVEGLAEQLLLSVFAQYENKSLEDSHTAVINVGGRHFDHFLHLFDSSKPHTINKKVACITDRDPESKIKTGKKEKFKRCYPYEYEADKVNYDYNFNVSSSKYPMGTHKNITFFTQDPINGKTLEYDILLSNPSLELLLTPSISNSDEISKLMQLYSAGKKLADMETVLRPSDENTRIKEGLAKADASQWDENSKMKALIASRYLNSVGKGENALELSYSLLENLELRSTTGYKDFAVPGYIKKTIDWICK